MIIKPKIIFISLGGILLLFLFIGMLLPSLNWDGMVMRRLNVRIFDRNTQKGIQNAKVAYKYPPNDLSGGGTMDPTYFDKEITSKTTDSNGCCMLHLGFGAGGEKSLLRTSGRFILANNIRVEAPGYQIFEGTLEKLAGSSSRPVSDQSSIDITIALYPETTLKN